MARPAGRSTTLLHGSRHRARVGIAKRPCGPDATSAAKRQSPQTNARFPDDHHGSVFQRRSGLRQRHPKPRGDGGGGVAAQAKDYDTYATRGPSQDLTEVKIGRQQDLPPTRRFLENPAIAGPVESDVEDVYCIVPLTSQPFGDARREIGVDEKSRGLLLGGNHLVPGQPRRVSKRLSNVFTLEIWILG